jgi:hypothetical protein|tara:strand:+ start:21 stop:395 length:375 start_codon:yes stop_codon:yes gene_type:complete
LEADEKIKGIVGEIGLKRNEGAFNAFSVNLSLTLKGSLTYAQAEKRITEMRKELLGKAVEIAEIIHLCPTCEKGFNTMQGMKQHIRMVHDKGKKKKTPAKKEKPKASPKKKKKRARKKTTRKKT